MNRAAQQLGRLGGLAKSEAKTAAAGAERKAKKADKAQKQATA